MVIPKLTKKSKVKFYRLFDHKEEDEYVIGREDTEEFIGAPEVGHAALRFLKQGKTIKQTEKLLKPKYGDTDVLDFANKLKREGFIKSIGGKPVHDKHKKVHHVLNWIKPKHVSWLYSGPAYFMYFLIILTALVVMMTFTQYLPRYKDFFFHESLTVIYLVSFFLGWLVVAGHELSHFLAVRSLGVPASFSIGNRLYFLVAETNISDIWEIEPRRMYRAYLAGIVYDILVLSMAVLLMYLNDIHMIYIGLLFYKLLKWLVLIQVISFLWQFLFFMETDIYYVVSNYFRMSDLMADTKNYVKNIWRRLKHKRPKPLGMTEKEMKIIKIYSGFWIFATFMTLFRFFVFQLPIALIFFSRALTKLGKTGNEFIDGITFTVLFLLDYGLLTYVLYRKYRQHGGLHMGGLFRHIFPKHTKHKKK